MDKHQTSANTPKCFLCVRMDATSRSQIHHTYDMLLLKYKRTDTWRSTIAFQRREPKIWHGACKDPCASFMTRKMSAYEVDINSKLAHLDQQIQMHSVRCKQAQVQEHCPNTLQISISRLERCAYLLLFTASGQPHNAAFIALPHARPVLRKSKRLPEVDNSQTSD